MNICYRRGVDLTLRTGSRRLRVLSFAFGSLLAGCKDKELQAQQIAENARKVTADSTRDATESLVDEAYKFRIEWPGEGWKLLGREEASRMAPDAAAAAVLVPGVFMVVLVEPAPATDLDQYVDRTRAASTVTGAEVVESRESIQFAGQDARRVVWADSSIAKPLRWVNTVFLHDGHAYQVFAWGPIETFGVRSLDPILAGFSILPGKVVAPTPAVAADRSGLGWRVASGVFESAATGLRVTPASGWQVVTDVALTKLNEDAEVGLQQAGLGGYVVLLPEPLGAATAAQYRATLVEQLADTLGSTVTGEWTATVAGQPIMFSQLQQEPLKYLLGALVVGDLGVQVLAWYPITARDPVRASLSEAVAGITMLGDATRSGLRAELAAAPDLHAHVGLDFALRNGTFRDFDARVVWRKPPGFWRMTVSDVTEANPVRSVDLASFESSVSASLTIEHRPGLDAGAWHDERVELYGGDVGESKPIRIADADARVTEIPLRHGALDLRMRVGTLQRGPYAIEVLVSGHASESASAAADVAAIFGGLELVDELPRTAEVGGEYIDERLGFALRPPVGWTRTDESTPQLAPNATNLQWADGRKRLLLLAMNWGGAAAADPEFLVQLIEQNMREKYTTRLGAATVVAATLAGLPAQHSKWTSLLEDVNLWATSRGQTAYMLITVNLDDDERESVLRSVRLLK